MGNACSSTQATAASSPEKAHEAASAKSKSAQQQQLSPQQSQPQQNVAASPGKPKEGSVQFVEAAKEQNHSALETAAEYLEVEKAAVSMRDVVQVTCLERSTWAPQCICLCASCLRLWAAIKVGDLTSMHDFYEAFNIFNCTTAGCWVKGLKELHQESKHMGHRADC
jgi:hypothetical protein